MFNEDTKELKNKIGRNDISTDLLKRVIIRVDFVGLRDFDNYLDYLAIQSFFRHTFQQEGSYKYLPRTYADSEDNDRSVVIRFSNCKIGPSKVTLDISKRYAILDIRCAIPYEGTTQYSDFMVDLLASLKLFDVDIYFSRIGIRKIDMAEFDNIQEAKNVFEKDFPIIMSWELSSLNGAYRRQYSEQLKVDTVQYTCVQKIDKTTESNKLRVIYDVDAYMSDDTIDFDEMLLTSGFNQETDSAMSFLIDSKRTLRKIINEKFHDKMFEFFKGIVSLSYLELCRKK